MKSLTLLFILLVSILIANPIMAGSKKAITGFKDYKLGMPESEFRKKFKIIKSIPHNDDTIHIMGENLVQSITYETGVLFKNNKVDMVRLLNNQEINNAKCMNLYDDVLSMIRARYGEPDKQVFDTQSWKGVMFFDSSGNMLVVSAEHSEDCKLIIGYKLVEGDTF